MPSQWATLPEPAAYSRIHDLDKILRGGWRPYFRTAGIRVRKGPADRILVRADDEQPLVRIEKLTNNQGRMRTTAASTLARVPTADVDFSSTVTDLGQDSLELSRWGELQVSLWTSSDELHTLQQIASKHDCDLYHLQSTDRYQHRQVVLTILDDISSGVAPRDLILGTRRNEGYLVRGLIEISPHLFVCSPLIARNQPFCAVLMLRNGAHVALVPRHGAFSRITSLTGWATGLSGLDFENSTSQTYEFRDRRIPRGTGESLLQTLAHGTDKTLQFLTDPANWCDAAGCYDPAERLITWATALLGMEGIRTIGNLWGSEQIWTAFRSLDCLAGLQARGRNRNALRNLLMPSYIREHALTFFSGYHHQWADDIVDSFARHTSQAFPDGSEAEQARCLVELRNLIHGAGVPELSRRNARLDALSALDRMRGAPSLRPLLDIAAIWWTAAILAPDQFLRGSNLPVLPTPNSPYT